MVGLVDLHRILAELPDRLERNVLRGAMKAGADVIAEAARDECVSSEVRASISTTASVKGRVVTALVQTKGQGAYMAPWLEYGTEPHFIVANDSEGRTVNRLNRLSKQGSLAIGGKFVGKVVWHPGSRKIPFMRPALDQHEDKAVTVIGGQIAARLGKLGGAVALAGSEA